MAEARLYPSIRWRVIAAGLASGAIFATVRAAPPVFVPVTFDVDFSLARYRGAVGEGFRIQPTPDRPAMMKVYDTGRPAFVALPAVPSHQGYLLKLKAKFHAPDQTLDLIVNGQPMSTLRASASGRAQKRSLWLPPGRLGEGRNILELRHQGTPGQTEFEQVRVINYLVVLSDIHRAYLVFNHPPGRRRGLCLVVAVLLQCLGACGVIAVLWSSSALRRPPTPWLALLPWIAAVGGCAWLLLLSGLLPYRLVFPGALVWTVTAAACGGFLGSMFLIDPAGSHAPWRQRLTRVVPDAQAFGEIFAMRHPFLVRRARGVAHTIGRAGVPTLLVIIVAYGALLRCNQWFAQANHAWNFLGTTNDIALIMDAAVRVLGTGTFTQYDGSYARVTGLAGYGLGTLAMAAGGVYPGFAWLQAWFLVIGAALPLVGFAVVNAACGSAIGGLAVAALLASEPILIQESLTIYHDVPATLCAGLSLYWLARVLRQESYRPRPAIALGLSAGATILAKMSHACLVMVILASAALRRWTAARWKTTGVALTVTVLVLGVWMGRNARVLGAPILSSQSGFIFACSTGQAVTRPPGVELSTVGLEQRLNAVYVRQAMGWITRHPREYLTDAVRKVWTFWREAPSPWVRPLSWGLLAGLAMLATWERRLLAPMTPVGLYLILYSVTFGFTWAALPTYYPPFLFLLIIACAPLFVGTYGRLWQFVRWLGHALGFPRSLVHAAAVVVCLEIALPFLCAPWEAFSRDRQRARDEQGYLAWAGTILPEEAVILKTDVGDPWDAQRLTRRPIVFNVMNGIPWLVYQTPYGAREFRRDWQSGSSSLTSFGFDIPRHQASIDAIAALTPRELQQARDLGGVRGLLTIWRRHGRQLFVLDKDAVALAEDFLPRNAYALRGDELTLKPYRAWPQNPSRVVYRLVERDDPRLDVFGVSAEQSVTWTTAPCLRQEATTVWFTGAFGPNPGMAQLLVNGTHALSFRLGPLGDAAWAENGYRLAYWQRQPWAADTDGLKRSIGTFALTVPTEAVEAGRPLTLSVSPLLVTNDPDSWFGLLDRSGTSPIAGDGFAEQPVDGVGVIQRASIVLRDAVDEQSRPMTLWLARAQMERG